MNFCQQSGDGKGDEVLFAIALGKNDVENPSVTAEEQVAVRLNEHRPRSLRT